MNCRSKLVQDSLELSGIPNSDDFCAKVEDALLITVKGHECRMSRKAVYGQYWLYGKPQFDESVLFLILYKVFHPPPILSATVPLSAA